MFGKHGTPSALIQASHRGPVRCCVSCRQIDKRISVELRVHVDSEDSHYGNWVNLELGNFYGSLHIEYIGPMGEMCQLLLLGLSLRRVYVPKPRTSHLRFSKRYGSLFVSESVMIHLWTQSRSPPRHETVGAAWRRRKTELGKE